MAERTPRRPPSSARSSSRRPAAGARAGDSSSAASRASRAAATGDDASGFAGSLRLSGFSVLMLGLIVLAVLMLAPGLKTFFEQRQQIADLQAEVDYQQQQVESLGEERDRWSDPAYVRAQVRERLSFVMPGEVSFLVIDDVDRLGAEASQEITDDLQTTEVDWGRQLMLSTAYAGLGDPEPEQLEITGPQ